MSIIVVGMWKIVVVLYPVWSNQTQFAIYKSCFSKNVALLDSTRPKIKDFKTKD